MVLQEAERVVGHYGLAPMAVLPADAARHLHLHTEYSLLN
jgi:hypothetical protein